MNEGLRVALMIGWPFVAFLAAMGLGVVCGVGRSRSRGSYRTHSRGRSW